MQDLLDGVDTGPATLALWGEAGIGKTTIWVAGVAAADLRGYTVFQCRPAIAEIRLTYAGLTDLLVHVDDVVLDELPGPQRCALDAALLRSGESDPFASGNRDGLFVGLQSNWAIFDGRATSGRVAQARSIVEQNRLSLMQTKINAEVDVRRAYSSWQESNELVEASRKVVEQAQEAVRLANARYSAGTGTQLDVLQAQVDLTTARTNQVQAYYTYNVAVADLRRAMGLTDALVAQ